MKELIYKVYLPALLAVNDETYTKMLNCFIILFLQSHTQPLNIKLQGRRGVLKSDSNKLLGHGNNSFMFHWAI